MSTTVINLCEKYRPNSDEENKFDWLKHHNHVYCGRKNACRVKIYNMYLSFPGKKVDCKWANPFKVGKNCTIDESIVQYRKYLNNNKELLGSIHELKGKVLGCWCIGKHKCHAEILADIANKQ